MNFWRPTQFQIAAKKTKTRVANKFLNTLFVFWNKISCLAQSYELRTSFLKRPVCYAHLRSWEKLGRFSYKNIYMPTFHSFWSAVWKHFTRKKRLWTFWQTATTTKCTKNFQSTKPLVVTSCKSRPFASCTNHSLSDLKTKWNLGQILLRKDEGKGGKEIVHNKHTTFSSQIFTISKNKKKLHSSSS
jgi:hypothetical protein